MRVFGWLFLVFVLLTAALFFERDSAWVQDLLVRFGLKQPSIELPLTRSLTDTQGRSIDAIVVGFSKEELAFRRRPDSLEFVVSMSKLSEDDRTFFSTLEPRGSEEIARIRGSEGKMRAEAARKAKLQGRHAAWHRDIQMAKRDAETTDLPICLLMLRSEGDISDEIDRFVIRSTEFRDWANQHVVLCLYYNDPGNRFLDSGLDSATKEEARDLAKRYGVGKKTPAVVILNPNGTKKGGGSGYGGESTAVFIRKLEKLISGDTKGGTFSDD